MNEEDETTRRTELTALEQNNEPQKINQPSFATVSNNKAGIDNGKWHYLEVALLSTVVVIVLLLMLLPTIFYLLPPPITADGSQGNMSMEMGNQSNMSGLNTCFEPLARTDAINCSSGVVYTLPACQENLLLLQGCLPDRLNSRDVYVLVTDQEAVEAQANELLSGLDLLRPSPECRAAVRPFFCLYLFGLCDSRGMAYQPTFEECVRISTDVCESEWALANNFLALRGSSLPECTSFPRTDSALSGSGSSGEGETAIPPSLPSTGLAGQVNCSTLQCQEAFTCTTVRNTSLCLPVCGSWEETSHDTVLAIDVVVILSAAIGLIASIAVLVITCIRWKRMLTFPSVFVVYMTLTLLVIAVFILITYTDRTSLYCSSEYLVTFEMGEVQVAGPTAFCILAGIAFSYGLFQLTVFWFCHVVSLFWGIQFPFHARSFKAANRIKYIHITMVIAGVVLPTLPVIVAFTAGDPSARGFGVTRFPPILCTSLQMETTFYSLVFPINILIAIGVPLVVIIFRIIHKHYGLFRMKHSKHPIKIGAAECKSLIILCYYILMGVVALTAFTVTTRNGRLFAVAVAEYWQCETAGVNPDCDRLRYSFEQQSNPGLTAASFILLGIFPAVNLTFAVNIKEIKQKIKTWCDRAAAFYPSKE